MTRWQWFKFWLSSPHRFQYFFITRYYEITHWFWTKWIDRKVRQNNRWIRDRDPRANYFLHAPNNDDEYRRYLRSLLE
jgi:hypothetical protein